MDRVIASDGSMTPRSEKRRIALHVGVGVLLSFPVVVALWPTPDRLTRRYVLGNWQYNTQADLRPSRITFRNDGTFVRVSPRALPHEDAALVEIFETGTFSVSQHRLKLLAETQRTADLVDGSIIKTSDDRFTVVDRFGNEWRFQRSEPQ